MLKLSQKMRVIGILAATTGLRISEVLGLKWMDIDWTTLQMNVTRSVVDGIVGKCKTETSRRPVPIDEFTAGELLVWKKETCYAGPEDWVFASEQVQGKMPPWADTLLDRFLQPAAKKAGITKWVGFHTFRHTYSTLLKANNEDVKVVQELMRHANISTTMNIYTKALTPAKRGGAKPGGGCSYGPLTECRRKCRGECSMRTNVSKAYRVFSANPLSCWVY
jgi:integrase